MRLLRPTLALAAVGMLVGTVIAGAPAQAARVKPRPAAPTWAPAATAALHPGVMTFTQNSQCTANFVFTRATTSGTDVYLGQAAHCAGTGSQTSTNGCTSPSLPLGTEVKDRKANRIGTLAYSSWLMMRESNETDPNLCAYNDFALIKLDPAWAALTNPSVPNYGGPTGVRTDPLKALDDVYAIGNSSLRLGITQLGDHHGYAVSELGGGYSHQVYTAGPGIPGDSGGPLLDSAGNAAGLLSTITIYPLALSNNFADLSHALTYARAHGLGGLTLVPGDIAFHSSLF